MLTEDREKLRVLQPLQPWFSQEQREELAEVHPWIQQHTIPQEIDTQVGILNHTHTPQTYLSFYSTGHGFKCIFVSHRVVWAAAQPQGLPTLLSLLLLTARVFWSALSRTPLDLWLTLERLWSQNEPTTQLTENQPCQKPCQLLPRISSDQCEGNGSLCFSVKLNTFCKGIRGWTRPRGTQESRAMAIFTVSQFL